MRKLFCAAAVVISSCIGFASANTSGTYADSSAASLILPKGFKAVAVAEGYGGARHIVATRQGGIYIKLSRLKDGKGIYYMKDNNGDGQFDIVKGFGDYPGTGIDIKNDYLYASSNTSVYRYKLDAKGEVINPDKPETLVTGLVDHGRDNSKSIALDDNGNLYVNVGSYNNACIIEKGSTTAPTPCPLLDSVGGIWQFRADKLNQTMSVANRYATGYKNTVGLDWNRNTKSLFIMQHGRDGLDAYPQYFTKEQNAHLPAESMYEAKKGSNGGWPYAYYDHKQKKAMLAPEYGGDGKKPATVNAQTPTISFPAHLAPNGLLFYTGKAFPAKYRNGAFVAFHGNSQELKKGYFVGFVPFQGNKASGAWEVFADNFSTPNNPHRPCGLAESPDGSIYVTDDTKGTIYRISYVR